MGFRVAVARKGRVSYVSVVEDATARGRRRVRTIFSFGLDGPETRLRAELYLATLLRAIELAPSVDPKDDVVFFAVFGGILGVDECRHVLDHARGGRA